MATNIQRKDVGDGSSLLVVGPYDEDSAYSSISQKLSERTETPTTRSSAGGSDGGPIHRYTHQFLPISLGHLRSIALQGHEMSDALRKRRDELYRNEFPLLKPRFEVKCEDCGAEFDAEREDCSDCGSEALRPPDPAEKREAEQLFESVNREGQSLRELAKDCEPDQWLAGVSTLVIRYDYAVAQQSRLVDDGTIVGREVDELIRADPQSLVPVVSEHGRIGGWKWTCPVHRDKAAGEPGTCSECGADLREIFFVEFGAGDDDQFYFRDEVVTWAFPFPRLGGLDGLAPAAGVWVRQVILDMMDHYGAAYYDTNSDRLPGKFMILHTTNPDHWEAQLNKARDEDDPYDAPIFSNQYSPQDSSTPEVQVIDTMPDELLGQNQQIKSDYKSDIRQAFGVSDVHDSDLEDAGGLNNEGLQLEVTDRSIASQQHDYVEGWLDTLAKRLGIDDWRIEFLPSTGPDASDLQQEVKTAAMAARAGLDVSIEDGQVNIADGDVEIDAAAAGPGQLPGIDGQPAPGGGQPPVAGPDPTATESKSAVVQEALDVLEGGLRHIVWANSVEQKASPYFDTDDRVPEFVEELVRRAIQNGAVHTSFESLTPSARARLGNLLQENLTQPQGWSLRSIADDLVDVFALDPNDAETIARAEVKAINDQAREMGYEQQGLDDDDVFKWIGPLDERKEVPCLWLIGGDSLAGTSTGFDGTNPDYGGTPVSLEQLRDLVQEANDRFVDGHDARRWSPHIGCRDSYVQHYDR